MGSSNNPELARLLASLNAYQPGGRFLGREESQASNLTMPGFNTNFKNPPVTSIIPGLGSLTHESPLAQFPNTDPLANRQSTSQLTSARRGQSGPKQTAHAALSADPDQQTIASQAIIPDPSNITTWPAALKHVTKHLVPDVSVGARIKHLITTQHAHERQWHAGREAIITRQNGREGTKAQVSALLKSLGGKDVMSNQSPTKDEEKSRLENERELSAYDAKVYKGMLEMAGDFDRQLRKLGVPFFAIKWDLVILEAGPEKADASGRIRIDKGELRELQGRMMQLLEDLFLD